MSGVDGAATFHVSGDAYDRFMGRYSRPLATAFADAAGVEQGRRALDVGCGPGALTAELVGRVGPELVAAVDPSPPFVEACAARHPGVDVRLGRAEELQFDPGQFDVALSQLVFHFVGEPERAAGELCRVVRKGGTVGACVWDLEGGGMRMLDAFRAAVTAVDPDAPDATVTRRLGREGELGPLLAAAGADDVVEGALDVEVAYTGFDDFWEPFLGGAGPAGAYLASLDDGRRAAIRDELHALIGSPQGPFSLPARAWYAVGRA